MSLFFFSPQLVFINVTTATRGIQTLNIAVNARVPTFLKFNATISYKGNAEVLNVTAQTDLSIQPDVFIKLD